MTKERRSGSEGVDLKVMRIQRILDGQSEDQQKIETLSGQLDAANSTIASLESEIEETKGRIRSLNRIIKGKDKEIEDLEAENASLKSRTSSRPDTSSASSSGVENAFKRHCRALMLDPELISMLSEEQVKTFVGVAYKKCALKFHTDRGGDQERLKAVNAARDYFVPKPKQDVKPKDYRP